MIEQIIREYLVNEKIEGIGINVYCEVPQDKPDSYILIEKTSSGMEDRICSAAVAIRSISSESLYKAMLINEAAKDAMLRMAESTDSIYSCRLDTDYNFTDTQTKEYQYQAVFNLFY